MKLRNDKALENILCIYGNIIILISECSFSSIFPFIDGTESGVGSCGYVRMFPLRYYSISFHHEPRGNTTIAKGTIIDGSGNP